MATTQAGFFPVETYRSSSVSNGGTTVQEIDRTIDESRTVTDTKDIVNTKNLLDTKDLTETIQADIGGQVSFTITNTNKAPIPVPIGPINNPNTT